MRKVIVALCALSLVGCAHVQKEDVFVAAAVAAELAAQRNCPNTQEQLLALMGARILFASASGIADADRAMVFQLQAQTNIVCSIVAPQVNP